MADISLSSGEFKALSSESRVKIIKLLQKRNFTLSELSGKLSMALPTVKQHLGILSQAGIVNLVDEGRKWKYYTLTKKGKTIATSRESGVTVLLLLAASSIALLGVMYLFLGSLQPETVVGIETSMAAPAPMMEDESRVQEISDAPTPSAPIAGAGKAEEKAEEDMEIPETETQQTSEDSQMFYFYITALIVLSLLTGYLANLVWARRRT